MIITFITTIAWIGLIICGFLAFGGMFLKHKYHHGGTNGGPSLEKLIDQIEGKTTHWPLTTPCLVLFIICLSWIITTFIAPSIA